MADSNEMMMRTWGGLSPYEDFKISQMASNRANGSTVTALVIGSAGLLAGIGAWVFAPIFSNAKANGIRDLANAQFNANNVCRATLT